MSESRITGAVKVVARSPGKYPILIIQTASGGFFATHFESGYDLGAGKPVREEWIKDNAIGRHSFVAVEPPKELPPEDLPGYAESLRRTD